MGLTIVRKGRYPLGTIPVACLVSFALLVPLGIAQLRQHGTQRGQSPFDPGDGQDAILVQKRLKALNVERQKSLVADAQKLVNLATELDSEVKGMEGDSLTPEQVRKLNQIEKLAHEVKQKMRFTPTGGLETPDPLANPQQF